MIGRFIVSVFALTLVVGGCQTPLECGAEGEPCCASECGSPYLVCRSTAGTDLCVPTGAAMCDPITNSGCESGELCFVRDYDTEVAECVPAGEQGDGQACEFANSCRAGLYCNAYSNRCRQYCRHDRDCSGAQVCLGASDKGLPGLCYGSDACDLYSNAGCDTQSAVCRPWQRNGVETTYCEDASGIFAGPDQACTSHDDCPLGFVCVNSNGASACRLICDGQRYTCQIGYQCTPLDDTNAYLVCLPPAFIGGG